MIKLKRDFSNASKQKLLGMVDDVEKEKFCDFTDFVGDSYYKFQTWIGKLNIKNYLNDVDSYHKKVIDKNNTSKKEIEKIFANVTNVDTKYQNKMFSFKISLQKWDKYIVQMENIVNPDNANFNEQFITNSLDNVLDEYKVSDFNTRLNTYIELDKTSGTYTYNWDEIENLLKKDNADLTTEDYEILTYILSTMIQDDETGSIDIENLHRFINAGYVTPKDITSSDFHESFETLSNGDKVSYYYLQNKSYMSDTLKKVAALYITMYEKGLIDAPSSDLSDLMKIVVENYSVVEWRKRVNLSRDYWSGELHISDKELAEFNEMCRADINIEYHDSKYDKDGSGLDYYIISSNASNKGNVRTATVDKSMINRNDIDTDGYSDVTIRMYIGCNNDNSDVKAATLNAETILSGYYKEFNLTDELKDETIDIVAGWTPIGANIIKTARDLSKQKEIIGEINSGIKAVKNANLKDDLGVSETTEKKVDSTLSGINRGIGLYTSWKSTEINNKKIDSDKNKLEEYNNSLAIQKNLGLRYSTMIVKYDHVSYTDSGTGIKVNDDKDCTKCTSCEINQINYSYDSELLREQYNSIMHQNNKSKYISDEEFAELEKEVQQYIQSGKVQDGSMLQKYIQEWNI